MNPINTAAQLMGNRTIVRRATATNNGSKVFLWELSDGATLELVRGEKGFKSVLERQVGFDALVQFYMRSHARVFSPTGHSNVA
ncbi:hypothetical protein [Pseudomonas aeruginosa]|jgi:hypothetical protein|uniref:hypothetical protein n=1 Tax=Pseudomonas aeruginosa TaxID=287 RepID=UPI0010437B4E|nr:hypothetical protein [Pseudomonas aeruginosa]MBO8337243.1 hypothetical protein [Pseudomonas aeruginosa]HCF4079448.1 hypothetical protein [Pseudomonas aeruginosa]HDV6122812.1 hypothetical protein [Pseudomonas aeruginosa]HDV6143690.1 hypothetical protein [Pseudomonas aeruginosa]HDV6167150.1 hypothetical protein [Pseudomonas aeruginosa]